MWVLEQQTDPLVYHADCFGIMTKVMYVDYHDDYKTIGMTFTYDENIRGFAQAADDALQTLEYIHNYRVPVDLYADDFVGE